MHKSRNEEFKRFRLSSDKFELCLTFSAFASRRWIFSILRYARKANTIGASAEWKAIYEEGK